MYERFLPFFMFMAIGSITPGPNNIILAALGCSVGVRRALPFLAGTTFGIGLMGFTLAFVFGKTVLFQEHLGIMIRIIGGGMLCWIAWKIATAPVGQSHTIACNASSGQCLPSSPATGFFGAVFFQWVNPKVWIVCMAGVGTYFSPNLSLMSQATLFSLVFMLTMGVSGFFWLYLGARLSKFLQDPFFGRVCNIFMAICIIGSMLPVLLTGW